jgi:hypothetical protein
MKRGVTLVDPSDAHLLDRNGMYVTDGYAQSKRTGRLHRAIAGEAPHVDHINHDRLDNRRRNLRRCSPQENQFNKKAITGKSRFKGVSWFSAERCWVVRIGLNGERIWVGRFREHEEELAARAYDEAAKRTYGEFAFLNFPEGGGPSPQL